jgi:hypothetical protein
VVSSIADASRLWLMVHAKAAWNSRAGLENANVELPGT